MISRSHAKRMTLRIKKNHVLINKQVYKLEINTTHEMTSKSQPLGSQILHKTIHGKIMLGSKSQV